MSKHYPYKRQPTIRPYDLETNSKGREYINRKLMKHFASFFKDGDKILFVGKHPLWDYSVFFNGPHKQCEYVISDIEPEMEPDVVDDITQSKFGSNEFDGIIIIGLFDSYRPGSRPEVFKSQLGRLVKSGGRVLMALNHFPPNGKYDAVLSWQDFYVEEVHRIFGRTHLVKNKDNGWIGKGNCQSIMLIMRRK